MWVKKVPTKAASTLCVPTSSTFRNEGEVAGTAELSSQRDPSRQMYIQPQSLLHQRARNGTRCQGLSMDGNLRRLYQPVRINVPERMNGIVGHLGHRLSQQRALPQSQHTLKTLKNGGATQLNFDRDHQDCARGPPGPLTTRVPFSHHDLNSGTCLQRVSSSRIEAWRREQNVLLPNVGHHKTQPRVKLEKPSRHQREGAKRPKRVRRTLVLATKAYNGQ